MLERARYLLVSELAMAKNCEEAQIEEMLSKALSKSKLRFPGSLGFCSLRPDVGHQTRTTDQPFLRPNKCELRQT